VGASFKLQGILLVSEFIATRVGIYQFSHDTFGYGSGSMIKLLGKYHLLIMRKKQFLEYLLTFAK